MFHCVVAPQAALVVPTMIKSYFALNHCVANFILIFSLFLLRV
uniref:Uncharacterized protein n=1 Tax=Ciona intestinalis TaxID=7719 RepID=H2XX38_CIOIN